MTHQRAPLTPSMSGFFIKLKRRLHLRRLSRRVGRNDAPEFLNEGSEQDELLHRLRRAGW